MARLPAVAAIASRCSPTQADSPMVLVFHWAMNPNRASLAAKKYLAVRTCRCLACGAHFIRQGQIMLNILFA